jgi:hypothetical protein
MQEKYKSHENSSKGLGFLSRDDKFPTKNQSKSIRDNERPPSNK